MRGFQEFRGSLKFAPTGEMPVEGDHAKFHKRGRIATKHSVRYMSFVRRIGELECHTRQNPHIIPVVGRFMEEHITAWQMVSAPGLNNHPAS